MTPNRHTVTAADFRALAQGRGGRSALAALAAGQYSKVLLLLRAVADLSRSRRHAMAPVTTEAYDALCEVHRAHPGPTREVIMYPTVGAWAAATVRQLIRGEADARPERLAGVTASVAIRAGVPLTLPVPRDGEQVDLPALGRLRVPGTDTDLVRLRWDGSAGSVGRVALPGDLALDDANWQAIRRVGFGPLALAIDDVDPYRPAGDRVLRDRLAPAEAERWGERMARGWHLLRDGHPEFSDEVLTILSAIVPLDGAARLSSTSRTAFGALSMSYPPGPRITAETLAHEVQHAKLGALCDLFDLTVARSGQLFSAPWRPDLRPADALLQGIYAHLGVTRFWRAQARREEDIRLRLPALRLFAKWRAATLATAKALAASAELTPMGREFTDVMIKVLLEWNDEPVPGAALAPGRVGPPPESLNGSVMK
ncbi:HEXXH motif domain-containing protein [Acrocarpospora catenulata]|uniref:HEXXH motif domain-containing protein n=1 Tax=Acrocarpospora catenulata TaxID=2836182 RepID=UPI001BD97765|nr:HEXXH motif domain-containing protein [Acrocarpospora catenulata]